MNANKDKVRDRKGERESEREGERKEIEMYGARIRESGREK